MNQNANRSWWSRQTWVTQLLIVVVVLVVLGLLLSIPTYWDWASGS